MFSCDICFKSFTHEGNLQAHVRAVHFGEKRYRKPNRFVCEICFKSLCSKRSYDEHKNTHFNSRPFKCRMCQYAAASQMTLRRHTLRQHVHKSGWHYQCPYCLSAFVEPTSYQFHLQQKHPTFSGTFGCESCEFSTLSSKTFIEHLEKHSRGEILDTFSGQPRFLKKPFDDDLTIREYLIDDEMGRGYDLTKDSAYKQTLLDQKTGQNGVYVLTRCSKYDHGYHTSDAENGTSNHVIRSPANSHVIRLETDQLYVPEPCFQIEISSSSNQISQKLRKKSIIDQQKSIISKEKSILNREKSIIDQEKSIIDHNHNTKDLGMHVLPDGQVDFDLD